MVRASGRAKAAKSRAQAVAFAAALTSGVMAGCNTGAATPTPTPLPHYSTAAPPVVYCGQTLFVSDSGIYSHLVPPSGTFTVPSVWLHASAGSLPIAIQLTSSCAEGDTLSVAPTGVIRIAKTAVASNGEPVGLLIYGSHPGTTTITATNSNGATADIVLVVQS